MVTDLERIVVAWELWSRRSHAVAHGITAWPLAAGMFIGASMVAVPVGRQLLG
ncbi:MAG: hypothetical protein ACM3UO_00035 [Bacillota bacterium]